MSSAALANTSLTSISPTESSQAYVAELPRLSADFPAFVPAWGFAGGHRQTLGGVFWPIRGVEYKATQFRVTLADGDELVLHDDCPAGWQAGDRAVLMIHGLTGSYLSHYMKRLAHKLSKRGIRAFRLDLRGCGAGVGLARWPYHCGRSEDARAALVEIARLCPGSPVTVVGYSLGGSITIKLLGELAGNNSGSLDSVGLDCGGLDSAIAVCPPIDLERCSEHLGRFLNRIYDRHFVKHMVQHVYSTRQLRPDLPFEEFRKKPRGIKEFDHEFTAPYGGYGDVATYYNLASGKKYLPVIRHPLLLVAPQDDPMIPANLYDDSPKSPYVDIQHPTGGGHLGFIARRGIDPDQRWIDWRILDWIAGWEKLKAKFT